jgi:hypothetical protein
MDAYKCKTNVEIKITSETLFGHPFKSEGCLEKGC